VRTGIDFGCRAAGQNWARNPSGGGPFSVTKDDGAYRNGQEIIIIARTLKHGGHGGYYAPDYG
jgi:hypothetical protein